MIHYLQCNRVKFVQFLFSFVFIVKIRPALALSSSGYRTLLSSHGVESNIFWKHVKPHREDYASLLYIPTASMWLDPESTSERSIGERKRRARASSKKKLSGIVRTLEEGGDACGRRVASEVLDVSVESEETVFEAMSSVDCVYVEGGNTFWLAAHLKRTNFDNAFRSATDARDAASPLLYVGISAGAICAGADLRTALWKGWDKPVSELDVSNPSQMRGLRLVNDDVSFFPHFTEEWAGVVSSQVQSLKHNRCVCLAEHQSPPCQSHLPSSTGARSGARVVDYWVSSH